MHIYKEYEIFQNISISDLCIENTVFEECRFEHCILENTTLRNCQFSSCVFTDCKITNPTITHTVMTLSEFIRCHLVGIDWASLLDGGFLIPIERLKACKLKYNNFLEINFTRFDFSDNFIDSSMFANCNLVQSNFTNCGFNGSEFFHCDLSKADFRDATDYIIDIETCQLSGAHFSFPEVVNLLKNTGIIID